MLLGSQRKTELWVVFFSISGSDLVLLLICDAAQVDNYEKISHMNPTTSWDFSWIPVKPLAISWTGLPQIYKCDRCLFQGDGRLYVQGKEINGAGINSTFAVLQKLAADCEGRIACGIARRNQI